MAEDYFSTIHLYFGRLSVANHRRTGRVFRERRTNWDDRDKNEVMAWAKYYRPNSDGIRSVEEVNAKIRVKIKNLMF